MIAGVWVRLVSLLALPILIGATFQHLPNGWLFTAPGGGWEFPAFWTLALLVQAGLGAGAHAAFDRGHQHRPGDDLAGSWQGG